MESGFISFEIKGDADERRLSKRLHRAVAFSQEAGTKIRRRERGLLLLRGRRACERGQSRGTLAHQLPDWNLREHTRVSAAQFEQDREPATVDASRRGRPRHRSAEGAAILGDILTFYQELYANEAYLSTAVWRESIAELVRLVGYRLSPGMGGNATFAFEVKGKKAVTVPAHFPLKAQLEEHDKPSEFETTSELQAYPWLSRFNLFRPFQTTQVMPATTEFTSPAESISLSPVVLKKGDDY